ncbi:hypothetical protein MNBD_GAMMA13-275 [hydrothermal vent metagenome]|uniref:PIN domain-containing protein n=1 Tax=hydrothermal vent metagenome TaxID=652676 RepID=A0A3B0YBD7_9ZZZZ
MISIDTNVLLRYLLMDDEVQSPKAVKRITGKKKVLVTDVVLAETTWALKGKRYKLTQDVIVQVLHSLFEEPNIVFEDGSTIWRAMHDYRLAEPIKIGGKKKQADFADALVVNKSKYVVSCIGEELEAVYTFDTAARKIDGTKAP